jgi:hypothetical protein
MGDMSEQDLSEHPFADRRVRALIGLSGSLMIAVVAVLFIDDPTLRWAMLGIAALDVIVTPYILGLVFEQSEHGDSPVWSGD